MKFMAIHGKAMKSNRNKNGPLYIFPVIPK